jgi:hypothetical protein
VPVPPRQKILLCRQADCEVVYFADQGLEIRIADLHTVPGFKQAGAQQGGGGLCCYCFLHSRESIVEEVRASGTSPTLDRIRGRVKEQGCACEVRNPSGKCCLKDIQDIVDQTLREGAS